MSKSHNQWLSRWKVVFDSLKRTPFVRGSVPLSDRDNATWAEAILLQGMMMEDLNLSMPASFRTAKQWCMEMRQVDCKVVSRSLKWLDSWLLDSIEHHRFFSLADFKRRSTGENGVHAGTIFAPVQRDLAEFGRSLSIERFRALHQFAAFLGRVSFRDIDSQEVVDDFVVTDACLASPDPKLASALNQVLREWLAGFCVCDFPQHGPGSTSDAGGDSLLRKYAHLGTDSLLSYVLDRNGYRVSELIPFEPAPWERTAKLQCVPKSALTQRTICMEPATLQYFQQMVRKSLYRFMEQSPAISRHIRLRDQTFNQNLAKRGSLTGQFATIDLSKASDSVSWDLARTAFRGTPLLPWLYATRSRKVVCPDGRVVVAKKFAPMGSALCFPIECLIFAATCECAVRQFGYLCRSQTYRVYGDDIAITTELVDVVMSYLGRLGFTVNSDKSFTNTEHPIFRESCGGEFLDGQDVSPVRIPRRFSGGVLSVHHANRMVDFVALANNCFDAGLLGCRAWLIARLHTLPPHLQPPFGETDSSLHSYTVTNYRHKKRKMGVRGPSAPDYQVVEVQHGRSFSRVKPSGNSLQEESCRLFHWLLVAADHPDRIDPVIAEVGPNSRPVLQSAWTPETWL